MQIEQETNRGTYLIPLETRMLKKRHIEINGEIDFAVTNIFYYELLYLDEEDSNAPIDIDIDSPGGAVDAGLAILDLIWNCHAPVRMHCIGRAYSMAAMIFAAGSDDRDMLPHSKLMLHQPLVGQNMGGNVTDIQSLSESLLRTKEELNLILADKTGKTIEEIDQATSFDHYFTAQEAIDFGLCDAIAGSEKKGKSAL